MTSLSFTPCSDTLALHDSFFAIRAVQALQLSAARRKPLLGVCKNYSSPYWEG